MERVQIHIIGRVQGVFFRHSARLHAEKLGLTGWARNEDDASVTIVAEGLEESLEQFLEWCRKGPPLAKIEQVRIEWTDATEEFKRFEIL
ncbi:MAG: acylphosphatase [Candidatus Sungbacteria bacterium]|uniref:acylphosphatase n=1 Tax=Candidatus Sungiibacteriota bacterium TaxID=2750080 RepID=A0A932YZ75_9BACT|nr:acylphosphatase [Candidatus Sungbacteria bacterium]